MIANWLRRIRHLLNRRQSERDLIEEMTAHRAMLGEDERRTFGSELRLREESRDAWGFRWVDQVTQDLHYAIRTLSHSPGFVATAVGVLALGIGANLAIFQVFNAALFYRLTIRDAGNILEFDRSGRFALPVAEFLREHASLFRYMVAEKNDATVIVESGPDPEGTTFVTDDYFAHLGLVPARGGLLSPDQGGLPATMLSHAYWQRRFGGDPAIVGRVIRVNGRPMQIAGIAPADFIGLAFQAPSLWLLASDHAYLFPGSRIASDSQHRSMQLYAVLRNGVSEEAGNAQIDSLLNQLVTQEAEADRTTRQFATGRRLLSIPDDALAPIAMVTALTMLVLIVACANLGGVLLARGHARVREIEIRTSIGAAPARIVRQLMVENMLLSGLGSVAGIGTGYFAAKSLVAAAQIPLPLEIAFDWRMAIAGSVLAVVAVMLYGLAPAIQTVRCRTGASTRMRKVLVTVQVAASCFLLITTATLVSAMQQSLRVDARFDYGHMLVVDPQLYSRGLDGPSARDALRTLASRLEQLPGVRGVAMGVTAPFIRRGQVDVLPKARLDRQPVTPEYFALMNLPVLRGRLYRANEWDAVVLSESAATALWPGEDPIGKQLTMSRFLTEGLETGKTHVRGTDVRTIVGIVPDSSSNPALNPAEAYIPVSDDLVSHGIVVVNTAENPRNLLSSARNAALEAALTSRVTAMSDGVDRRGKMRVVAGSVGSLGATATLLAGIGIFGLLAFSVTQRTREIGVRIALGARSRNVVFALLSHFALPISAGIVFGVALAAAVGRMLSHQFFGVRAFDPLAYLASLALFVAVAALAVAIPARRAIRVDPAVALRPD